MSSARFFDGPEPTPADTVVEEVVEQLAGRLDAQDAAELLATLGVAGEIRYPILDRLSDLERADAEALR